MSDYYEKPSHPRNVLLAGYVTYWIAREQEGESAEDSFAAAGQAVAALLPQLSEGEARAVAHDIVDWTRSPEGMLFAAGISEDERELAEKRYLVWADEGSYPEIAADAAQ